MCGGSASISSAIDEDVEFRIELPEQTSAWDELTGKNAEAFDGARRNIGADRQHRLVP